MKKIFFSIQLSVIFTILTLYPVQAKISPNNTLTKTNAMQIIFGKKNLKKNIFPHQLTKEENKKFDIGDIGQGPLYTDIFAIKQFTENGIKKCFVLTETKNEMFNCHICGPIVGIALLTQQNDQWKVEINHQYIQKMGTFGVAPQPQLIKVGKGNYGLFFEDGYTGMGVTSSQVSIIAKVNDQYKFVLVDDDFYQDNEGTCGKDVHIECYKYSSKIKYLENDKDNFFPITITTAGNKFGAKDKLQKFSLVKKYLFSDGKYNLKK